MTEHLFYRKSTKQLYEEFKVSEEGLDEVEAARRLATYGKNEIKEAKPVSPWHIFFSQFKNTVIYILFGALIISALLGEFIDSIVIAAILILNGILGFIQEYKAEKSIEALKKMVSLHAVVLRDGKEKKIDAMEIVPGDILILETGEKVPADARLIQSVELEIQEAILTGESNPVKKDASVISKKVIVSDMLNMVFSGTIITRGNGKALVCSTGMRTEIGRIATLIQEETETVTPLQKKLATLGEWLGIATVGICTSIFIVGLLFGKPALEMFLIAVSLAVAAIPEGLPAVVTIALGLGVMRMVKKGTLIRKLPSVETLGSTTVICTDKTGTLTHNQMTVRKIYANGKVISVTGEGYKTEGIFTENDKAVDPKKFEMLLRIGLLCNDSKIQEKEVIGDPTEAALIVSAAKAGMKAEKLARIGELTFDSERKMMSTHHKSGTKKLVFTKGAPDRIIEQCDRILENGHVRRFTRDDERKISKMNENFASEALRVLGFAYKESSKLNEKNLIFVGLQAMMDPPRAEAREAIAKCQSAGIKVMMITGDHKVTAEAIGRELGLHGAAVTGQELDEIHDLEHVIDNITIIARADPSHKVLVLEALKKKGHIVAMTGDGVNDAPALKKADIGISMGIAGTDVAKEASDMILTDDNFASIVSAVEEGRGIYDNIKKFVNYLLSSNMGEVLIIFVATLIGLPLPLVAVQLLWINLVTDGLPALALGVDPIDKNIMRRPPRKKEENVLSKNMMLSIITIGVLMTIVTLVLMKFYLPDIAKARTVVFTTLVLLEMVRVQMIRSHYNIGLFSNKWLLLAIAGSIALQAAVVYLPFANAIFRTVPLALMDWGYMLLGCVAMFILGNLARLIIIKETHEMD